MTVAMSSMDDYEFIEKAIRSGQYPFQLEEKPQEFAAA
jgi:hypothetical protein